MRIDSSLMYAHAQFCTRWGPGIFAILCQYFCLLFVPFIASLPTPKRLPYGFHSSTVVPYIVPFSGTMTAPVK